ncbi:Uncharacterized protein HKD37_18G050565 [Glycine soja]
MQASDRFNINSQLEHLQAKYVGTGHADLNRFEWAVNIQRDSYASYIGHYPLLGFFAIAENESIGRERYSFMQFMLFYLRHQIRPLTIPISLFHFHLKNAPALWFASRKRRRLRIAIWIANGSHSTVNIAYDSLLYHVILSRIQMGCLTLI